MTETLKRTIEAAYEDRLSIQPEDNSHPARSAVEDCLAKLDQGTLRVAEKINGEWQVHQWLKKAVLLAFRFKKSKVTEAGYTRFFDKLDLRFASYDEAQFQKEKVRVVPGATVRRGSYIAPNVILMPSYVNIGAYVDSGTMVDTWVTVGSCAQIGKNVHISGGVGIGGVLEPLQANPTIIEDDCFIGARSEIVEGVVVESGSVISMGVYIGKSTRIYDRESGNIFYGRIPSGSVVVSGSIPSKDGSHSLYCAVIVKRVDEKTRSKTSINQLLRLAD